MHLRCPNCRAAIEVVLEPGSEHVTCPSCGSFVDVPAPPDQSVTISWAPKPAKVIGNYELLERVGRGAFGEVWRGRDTLLNKSVAIKIPRDDNVDEQSKVLFLREGRILAQLRHEHIVPVLSILQEDERFCIVSDFVEGVTLSQLIKLREFAPREAAELAEKIARALAHAHERGIVHRDLKPGNILMRNGAEPCVVDFGLAKQVAGDFTIAADGQLMGTAAYMSPEQAAGQNKEVDFRSDVYSLGVILYELLASHPPFVIGGPKVLLHQIQYDEPPPLRKLRPQCPRDLETICLKALHKIPGRRYQSAQEMADDLRRLLDGRPILARRTGVLERLGMSIRRHPRTYGAGLAAAVVIGGLSLALVVLGLAAPTVVKQRIELPVATTDAVPGGPTSPTATPAVNIHAAFWLRNPKTGEIDFERSLTKTYTKSPIVEDLIPGHYLVVVEVPGHGFHEVERYVPDPVEADKLPGEFRHHTWRLGPAGIVALHQIEVPPARVTSGMMFYRGDPQFAAGAPSYSLNPRHTRLVPAFHLDATEVTVGEFRSVMVSLPEGLRKNPPPADFPITRLSHHACVNYAEVIGKRLPDEFELEYAATDGGRTAFPWGPVLGKPPTAGLHSVRTAPQYATRTTPQVYGLCDNAAEFTSSWYWIPEVGNPEVSDPLRDRVLRGDIATFQETAGRPLDWTILARSRWGVPLITAKESIGFRCARSEKPRLRREDFGRQLLAAERDKSASAALKATFEP